MLASPGQSATVFQTAVNESMTSSYQAAVQAGTAEPPSNLPSGINYSCPYQPLPSTCK